MSIPLLSFFLHRLCKISESETRSLTPGFGRRSFQSLTLSTSYYELLSLHTVPPQDVWDRYCPGSLGARSLLAIWAFFLDRSADGHSLQESLV